MEHVQTVIVGAGQAGLAMSYHLGRLGHEHLVLERGRIAERWRSERWDSLMFQFPNWMLRLPEHAYAGADPDGFMHRDGVVSFIEAFATRISPPIRCGVRVTGLQWSPAGRFRVETDHYCVEARNVVVATGPYQKAVMPAFGSALPFHVHQTTANAYTNPRVLPPGNVLVVGAGGSGWQIAEELAQSGRLVYLSVGRHRRVPRRYRGRDFGWWQEQTGASDQVVGDPSRGARAPLLTGVGGGHDADLRALARQGVRLAGSLRGIGDGRLRFAPDLEENLALGDRAFEQFTRLVDECIIRQGLEAPDEPGHGPRHAGVPPPLPEINELDVKSAGITSVIWAVGYRYDFGWIRCNVLDADGAPLHRRGVTATPGLYFLGLPRLHKVKSAFLWGVGEDAAYLAERIVSGVAR